MCRASSTTARPLNRRMRQRSSAVPIAARSSPPAERNRDRLLGLPGALAVSHGRHPRKRSPSRGYGRSTKTERLRAVSGARRQDRGASEAESRARAATELESTFTVRLAEWRCLASRGSPTIHASKELGDSGYRSRHISAKGA